MANATPVSHFQRGCEALEGKKLFILGAGSGMGAAIAKMAVAKGAKVALSGRSEEKLKRTASELGDAVLGIYPLDAVDSQAVDAALADKAPYDHIVTTAADLTFKPFVELSDDDIEKMLGSKFFAPLNIARGANQYLNANGSVLFFSGLAAYRQGEGSSIVGALNMALESLAANLAIEMKPKRFNVISPGVVDAGSWDFLSDADRQALFDSVAASLPVGRVGHVDDLAHAAIGLMENGFITGTVVNVDGGGRIA
ncbi:SDR family oxidoreductase [Gallaecimonas mangrovi]|uniref:SDR family oxidoreductase n=1 Tax=Gallaecimonas mangrovi TaxID=2291597 RepID=UPI000E2035D5|nr:SDR family oxidoreductase [Gallaecimonas mangrovi]